MNVHTDTIHSVEKDVYERRILTACADGVVRVFENTNDPNDNIEMELKHELVLSNGPAIKACFVGKTNNIVGAYYSGMIVLWEMTGAGYVKIYEKQLPSGSVSDIACHYCTSYITVYVACLDGNIKILKLSNKNLLEEENIIAHRFGASCVDHGCTYTVSGGLDYSVAVWKDNVEIARFRNHDSFVRDVCIAPENVFDVFCFASASEDGTVVIYNKCDEEFTTQVIRCNEPVHSLAWSKSGFTLSVAYGENKYKCYIPNVSGKFEEVSIKEGN